MIDLNILHRSIKWSTNLKRNGKSTYGSIGSIGCSIGIFKNY